MIKAKLLFADNNPNFLNTRKEFLEEAGYQVLPARNPHEARAILEQGRIDLAILDIRLVNDDDPKDLSGIQLAKETDGAVPKIMLTGYPTPKTVIEALRPALQGLSSVVDFISKKDGSDKLLGAVQKELNRRVFIVHGRDNEAKEMVARFIEKLHLRAVILHEQPGGGRTIIEKFEDYANVGFAVALLTPDDVGGLRESRETPQELQPRSRQNVIFELGYFIGKLGRSRVSVLYKKGVELPSDYLGVLYTEMAGDSWKLPLAQNMKHVGLDVDLNRAVMN
jgi:predicted nucleotide-binding protein